jgi:hypothetical protein
MEDQPERLAASIKRLTPEHQAAVDSFLLADHPIDKLVSLILDEWKELEGSTPAAVRRMLYRYKDKAIKPKQAKLAAKHTSNVELQNMVAHIHKLEDRLNPVLALEELVIQQQHRIQKMAKTEASAPTLLESQTKNINLMGDLLTKLINAQLEVGVLTRVPKKMQVSAIDISEEERTFMETAAIADRQAAFLVDSFRLLRNDGVIDVQSTLKADTDADR